MISNINNNNKVTDRYKLETQIIEEANIIACTLSVCGSDLISKIKKHFDLVIIDEAGQCSEISTLIPLRYEIDKLILLGDHLQLPPTLFSEISKQLNYERSLFERFKDNNVTSHLLNTQ